MSDNSPARVYAIVVGAVLALAGIIGFFYNSEFTSDKSVRDSVFGILEVNGWHNVVHLASGLVGLAMARSVTTARQFALAFGVVYLAVAVWGFVIGDGDSILSIIPVNTEDNILHLVIGVAGLGAYAASARETTTARPATA